MDKIRSIQKCAFAVVVVTQSNRKMYRLQLYKFICNIMRMQTHHTVWVCVHWTHPSNEFISNIVIVNNSRNVKKIIWFLVVVTLKCRRLQIVHQSASIHISKFINCHSFGFLFIILRRNWRHWTVTKASILKVNVLIIVQFKAYLSSHIYPTK